MTLMEWDQKVSPHLQLIEAGSKMVVRHAAALPCKAEFETLAENELSSARAALESALQNVIAAQTVYVSKPKENDRAA